MSASIIGRMLCLTTLCLAMLGAGCSVKRMAVNKVGDALAGGGTTFASDDDPELVKAAVPFSLKLMESLLAENPHHQKLLLAACSGFTSPWLISQSSTVERRLRASARHSRPAPRLAMVAGTETDTFFMGFWRL